MPDDDSTFTPQERLGHTLYFSLNGKKKKPNPGADKIAEAMRRRAMGEQVTSGHERSGA